MREVTAAPPTAHAAQESERVDHIPRLRSAPAPNPAALAPEPRRRWALSRIVAALGLVLLLGATGLVFTQSRPLADVDIEVVSVGPLHCRAAEPCPGPRRASVRGTVAAATATRNATVLVLVRTGSHGEWSVAAEAQPDENGDWRVADLVVPPEAASSVEVRAIVSTPSARVYADRETVAGMAAALQASRVVRVAPEMPALERAP